VESSVADSLWCNAQSAVISCSAQNCKMCTFLENMNDSDGLTSSNCKKDISNNTFSRLPLEIFKKSNNLPAVSDNGDKEGETKDEELVMDSDITKTVSFQETTEVRMLSRDSNENTLLHHAALDGNCEIIKQLLAISMQKKAYSYVNSINKAENTPLHLATSKGHFDAVQILIEYSCNIDATDVKGNSALLAASFNGHDGIVQLLLKNDANMNTMNNKGDTPLHNAASEGHIEVVKTLIKHGADVNAVNKNGYTCLHVAHNTGYNKLIQILLENCYDVNMVNTYGCTALHFAACKGDCEFVEMLLQHDADVTIVDKGGNTALQMAVINNHTAVIKLLSNKSRICAESDGIQYQLADDFDSDDCTFKENKSDDSLPMISNMEEKVQPWQLDIDGVVPDISVLKKIVFQRK